MNAHRVRLIKFVAAETFVMLCIVASGFVGAAIARQAPTVPTVPAAVPATVPAIEADPGCIMIAGGADVEPMAEALHGADYIGASATASGLGEWVAENGDGPIFGYSLAEDSAVWNLPSCA